MGPPPVKAKEPVEGPRRRASMRLRPMRKDKKDDKKGKKDKIDEGPETEHRSECVIM
jgi:hypothetical protein